ncbi:hypothetical protein Tco_0878125 [Tanacetum coccineum]|uniref:Uncharacterized protein n=1 Tax=Tanacetum coccineum TaxID=301880 RepID=A0ABQ5C2W4_9ASTR
MDQDFAHMVVAYKVPMLKPGEYEIWRMRIEQYIHMINYALWEVIENGIPIEHQFKFNSIKDAKLLMEAIEKRFGRNAATKNSRKSLKEAIWKNFTAHARDCLDKLLIGFKSLYKKDKDRRDHGSGCCGSCCAAEVLASPVLYLTRLWNVTGELPRKVPSNAWYGCPLESINYVIHDIIHMGIVLAATGGGWWAEVACMGAGE